MTDPDDMTRPHDPLDDLLSAHLDGATTPEEAARLAADPVAQARLRQLEQVRRAIQAPTPVDDATRERAIAAALAAFDAQPDDGADGAGTGRATVTPLAPIARRGPSPQLVRVLGVAAAVLLLAALVPLLGQLGSSSDDEDSASSAPDAAADLAEDGDAEAAGEEAAGGGALAPSSTTVAGGEDSAAPPTADLDALDDLGAFADVDELLAAVRAGPGAESGFVPEAGDGPQEQDGRAFQATSPPACVLARLPSGTVGPFAVQQARVAGVVVTVVISGPVDDRTITVAEAEGTCPLLAEEPLAP
jgi:hypothetical protein